MNNMSRDQRYMLIVLTLINFLNYLDRQVVFPLFSHLKADFGLTDVSLGILSTVFLLVHSLAAVPLGILADRFSRRALISISVMFWSVASFASGLANSFRALLGIRSLVGLGEAGYAPAAVAMITDNFPEHVHARAQGFFNVGMMIGGTSGAVLGGMVAYYFNNWRLAFFIASVPGFLLAYMMFRVRETRVVHHEPKISLLSLWSNRAYRWIIVSGTLVSFASGAFITWGVEFIARYKDYNLRDAGLILGLTMMCAGSLGILIGSSMADYLHKKYAWGRSSVVALSLILSAPLMYAGLVAQNQRSFLVFFFLGAMFLSVYLGPVTAVLHDTVPKQFRASAFGVYVLIIHLVGEATAPVVVGWISDGYGLRNGLIFATGFVLLAGICFVPVMMLNREKTNLAA